MDYISSGNVTEFDSSSLGLNSSSALDQMEPVTTGIVDDHLTKVVRNAMLSDTGNYSMPTGTPMHPFVQWILIFGFITMLFMPFCCLFSLICQSFCKNKNDDKGDGTNRRISDRHRQSTFTTSIV